MKNRKMYLGIAILVFFGMLFTSCEFNFGDMEDELVLNSGYAWVSDDWDLDWDWNWGWDWGIDDDSYGFVFKSNDCVDMIKKHNGQWNKTGTTQYFADGDQLAIFGEEIYEFEVYGNTLVLDGEHFEKRRIGKY